jgi:hypothetical protein
MVGRNLPAFGGQRFDQVLLHLDRLAHAKRFTPIRAADGTLSPRRVFVASMGDWAHHDVPDTALHQIFDAMEAQPTVVFQLLTKRPIRARRLLAARYGRRGVPSHIWIGVSAEDNRVAGRLDILRTIRDRCGAMTTFASIEPIVGPTDQLDFAGVDWALFGGESGAGARVMFPEWLLGGLERAQLAGAAIWLKQHGTIRSNPLLPHAPAHLGITARFRWLVEHGLERVPDEKGGATLEGGVTHRELPQAFHDLRRCMNWQGSII